MGIKDRDYYWEDRKRREEKFSKNDTYYRPKEFRGKGYPVLSLWPRRFDLLSFVLGGVVAFLTTMVILNMDADLLYYSFYVTGEMLKKIGLM